MRLNGWDFKTVAAEVDKLVCQSGNRRTEPRCPEDQRPALRALWRISQPISAECIAGKYLRARCALTVYPSCLRFVPRLYHAETRSTHPGILALFSSPDGRACHLHKTFLHPEGGTAHLMEPRLFARGKIDGGGAVRLAPAGATLGGGEGIETCLSASSLFGIPCWAALNSSLLKKWRAPVSAQHIVIGPVWTKVVRLLQAPRCGARTRSGAACKAPAIRGKARCRMHGGKSTGAPKGARNGNFRTGDWTQEVEAERRWMKQLVKQVTKGKG
jgi:hypothetical protein